MRIDAGMVICIIVEYILFVYYADTMYYRKRKSYLVHIISISLYTAHMIGCMFGNTAVNIVVFCIINFIAFKLCYYINLKDAIFQCILLTVLMTLSECAVLVLSELNINLSDVNNMSGAQSLMLTIISKTIYLAEIMLITHASKIKKGLGGIASTTLILAPICTMAISIIILKFNINSNMLSLIYILLLIINIIIFYYNQQLVLRESEETVLKERLEDESLRLSEYALINEKNEQMRMFHHDFKEHMDVLESLINIDESQSGDYIKSIREAEEEYRVVEYTDNKILNVLLTKKIGECRKHGIKFYLDPVPVHLGFIKDIDIVAIFSNLINNAIEGCMSSEEKNIYMDIYMANNSYLVIKIENNADIKPIVIDGKLKTHKKDNIAMHGIGMESIKNVLKSYDGDLSWSYDNAKRMFCTTVFINKIK